MGQGHKHMESLLRSQLLSPECITMCQIASQGGRPPSAPPVSAPGRGGGRAVPSAVRAGSAQRLADTFSKLLSKALMTRLFLGSSWSYLPWKMEESKCNHSPQPDPPNIPHIHSTTDWVTWSLRVWTSAPISDPLVSLPCNVTRASFFSASLSRSGSASPT